MPFVYDIDIVGSCNLRCPSCPVGNSAPLLAPAPEAPRSLIARLMTKVQEEPRRAKGMMSLELFERILDKIALDHDGRADIVVTLFNWGEPLLHPRVGEFIEAVKRRGYFSMVSTNLNFDKHLEDVVKAKPNRLRVSLSGMFKATYEKTHARGDILVLKQNCYRLRHLMERHSAAFGVELHFHLYRHNIFDDIVAARQLCEELGFEFHPGEAFLMPLEKIFDAIEGKPLSAEDQALIDLLLVTPQERAAISSKYPMADCVLRQNQVAINSNGSVGLCCATYDPRSDVAASYLEVSFTELQERRYSHPVCDKCFKLGAALADYSGPDVAEIKQLAGTRIRELGGKITFPVG